jgi:uncharacterized membrane protein YheB (UPF0754 family)
MAAQTPTKALQDELVDLKGALEQYLANTKSYAEVQQKIVHIARNWILAALLLGLLLGGGVGHFVR